MVRTRSVTERGSFYSNNKNYRNMQRKVSLLDPQLGEAMSKCRPELFGVSPYGRHSDPRKACFMQEAYSNPYFVLRELLREHVGSIKRYKKVSEKEYLALLAANLGDSVLVSTPVKSLVDDLIAYFILMRQPDYVFLSSRLFSESRDQIIKALKNLSNLCPEYLKIKIPKFEMMSMNMGVSPWAGLNPERCVIILHEYEHDNNLWDWDNSKYSLIEKYRDFDTFKVPMLGVSSLNPNANDMYNALRDYRELTLSNLTISSRKHISIGVDDLLYLKTDKSKVKYYKALAERHLDRKHTSTRKL